MISYQSASKATPQQTTFIDSTLRGIVLTNASVPDTPSPTRLDGLDLARFLAFAGMVIVNFKVVIGAGDAGAGAGALGILVGALEGRAAATFVVLAGVGLGLAGLKDINRTTAVTIRRAVFLLVVGLVNALIFEADIIHYYAFYFLVGVFLLPLSNRLVLLGIVMVNLVFCCMILLLDYNQGWNWENLTYSDFWTPAGFVRNLFFNGWHPVFPWVGFLFYGIMLSRMSLARWTTQRNLMIGGCLLVVLAETTGAIVTPLLAEIDPELTFLSTTEPLPPLPLYTIAGMGAASIVIGGCLALSGWAGRVGILRFVTPAGRQSLTLYLAHILIGVTALEVLGLIGDQSLTTAVIAALTFCACAMIYAYLWAKRFKRGPMETLMRRLAG